MHHRFKGDLENLSSNPIFRNYVRKARHNRTFVAKCQAIEVFSHYYMVKFFNSRCSKDLK